MSSVTQFGEVCPWEKEDPSPLKAWEDLAQNQLDKLWSYHIVRVTHNLAREGFPSGSDSKKICLQCRRPGFNPWLGRSSAEGNGYPLQHSCLENPRDRAAWRAAVHGVARIGHDGDTITLANEEAGLCHPGSTFWALNQDHFLGFRIFNLPSRGGGRMCRPPWVLKKGTMLTSVLCRLWSFP